MEKVKSIVLFFLDHPNIYTYRIVCGEDVLNDILKLKRIINSTIICFLLDGTRLVLYFQMGLH